MTKKELEKKIEQLENLVNDLELRLVKAHGEAEWFRASYERAKMYMKAKIKGENK